MLSHFSKWVEMTAWLSHSHSLTPPSQLNRGEKNDGKSLWVKIMTGKSLASYHHEQKRLDYGKIILICYQLKVQWDGEKHPSLNFTPSYFSTSPALSCAGRWECFDQSMTAALCHRSSHTCPLLLFMVTSFLQGTSTCFKERSSLAVGRYLLHTDLHELQGDRQLHHGLFQRLQGNLCSSSWNTLTTSFFNDLGVCRIVAVTVSHSSLSQFQFFGGFFFFSPLSLNTFPLRCLPPPPPQLCPVMGGLEPAGTICVLHRAAPESPHRHSPQPLLRSAPGHLHPEHLPTFFFPK